MSPRNPRNVVAATPGGHVTLDMILGFIAMSTVPDAPVSAAKLRRLWLAEGLEEKLVPKNRRAVDTFMSACRSVESRRTLTNGTLRSHEVKVDKVLENDTECVYQITRMIRDKSNRDIEFKASMRVVFSKADERITDDPLDRQGYKDLKALADAIRKHFDDNSSKVPGAKVRDAIRKTLAELLAVNYQNKGVYFVPKAGKSTLDSLQNVISGLYGDGRTDAELLLIPMMNGKDDRETVARHFTADVLGQIDVLQTEVTARNREGKGARSDRRENIVGQRKRIKVAVEKYRDMLDDRLLLLDEKLSILDRSLEQLLLESD